MATNEDIDARLGRWVESWRAALARCATIADDKARSHAQKVADELYAEGVRDCLKPLFKPARKKKKSK